MSFDDELQVSPALATPNVAEDLDKPLPAYDDLDFDLQLDSEPALNLTEPVVPTAVAPIAEPAAEETLADLEFTLDDPFESLVGEDEVEDEDDLPEFELRPWMPLSRRRAITNCRPCRRTSTCPWRRPSSCCPVTSRSRPRG